MALDIGMDGDVFTPSGHLTLDYLLGKLKQFGHLYMVYFSRTMNHAVVVYGISFTDGIAVMDPAVGEGLVHRKLDFFMEFKELDIGCGHPFGLEQEVTHVLIAAATIDQHLNVAIERLDHTEGLSEHKTVAINRKRIARLMQVKGLEAVHAKPKPSQPGEGHKIYPCLLKDVEIERVNQVWSTDITYIRLAQGFCYLVAVWIGTAGSC